VSEPSTIGKRIRAARKMRHMTVQALADAVNISPSLLEKFERGDRTPSPRHVLDLAKALRIGPDRLHGQPFLNGSESEDGVQAVIPDLRRIMLTYDSPEDPDAPPRPLDVVAAEMERVSQMRRDGQYVPMGPRLPALLTELTHIALDSPEGDRRERAFWWLAHGYRAANSLAHKLGYHDLSMTTIERFRWAAARSGDPYMDVIADYLQLGALLRQGAWGPATRLTVRLEQQIHDIAAGRFDNTARGLLGAVVLKTVAARARQGDLEGSTRAIEDAEEIAAASGGVDGVYYETSFGPGNVRIHEVHALIDIGDAATAVQRASEFEPGPHLPGERRSHHYIDLAAAQLMIGDRSGAFASLQRAREIAPNHTRFHPTTRSTAAALVRLDRAAHDSVAGFARWSGAI
jgi:transcriptional regulator with XRE-family HTH domain